MQAPPILQSDFSTYFMHSQTFFADPAGTWPSDLTEKFAQCRSIDASPNSYIDVYNDELAIKSMFKQVTAAVDTERLSREVDMTLAAGKECALPIVGRHFICGAVAGFITPFAKSLSDGLTDEIRPEIHKNRLAVINQFCALLDKLHSMQIVHGDVKPSNLVLDAAGNLRFIDFAEAAFDCEKRRVHASTIHYRSPTSMRIRSPLSLRDDLYAAGVTIWHIYTGRIPFENVDDDDLEDRIREGLQPDLCLIDDESIKALILKYLHAGESK
jgi:hypothetical protein